jgi:hypothetical protein
MIETLRRYWIGLLILTMIGLHAGIVGMIRIEANKAKESLSCEIDLGSFYVGRAADEGAVHLRVHALVPYSHRLQSRQLFDLNLSQVRQAVEEYCRQAEPGLLLDPLLTDLKESLMDCLVRTVGETAIEDIVITELYPDKERTSLAFTTSDGTIKSAGKMVMTRKVKDQQRKSAHEAAKADDHGDGHGGGHGDAHGGGHGDSHGGGHGDAHGSGHGDSHGSH